MSHMIFEHEGQLWCIREENEKLESIPNPIQVKWMKVICNMKGITNVEFKHGDE
jgi:hypothetical protein